MAKLSDVFLRLLGGTLEGISGMTPEVKAHQALAQQEADTHRLSAFANLNKDYNINFRTGDIPPQTAGLSNVTSNIQQPQISSGTIPVPGMSGYTMSPREQTYIPATQNASGDVTPGTPFTAPRGAKIIMGKSATSPVDREKAKNQAKIEREKPKAFGSFQNTMREYDNMIKEAEAVRDDSSLGYATGMLAPLGSVPATGAKRASARLETLKSKTLLNVLSSLKQLSTNGGSGFGQLSEKEGQAIQSSVSSLDRKLGTKDLQDSLNRFINEMKSRKDVLRNTFQDTYGGSLDMPDAKSGSQNTSSPALGTTIRVRNKQTGQTGSMPSANFDPNTYDQL